MLFDRKEYRYAICVLCDINHNTVDYRIKQNYNYNHCMMHKDIQIKERQKRDEQTIFVLLQAQMYIVKKVMT